MKKRIVSEKFKTINYKFLKNGPELVVILPRAGANFKSHERLIAEIGKSRSVLFVESGYFGISKFESNFDSIKMISFGQNLHDLINFLGYKYITLIGESVGAIQALNYAQHNNKLTSKIILSNPALYEPKFFHKILFIPMLKFGLNTSPDSVVKSLIKVLKAIPIKRVRNFGEAFKQVNDAIGAYSYLYCLSEIVDFNKVYTTEPVAKLLKKTIILKGKEDKIFDFLCNKNYCKRCSHYIEVNRVGHSIIDISPTKISAILN